MQFECHYRTDRSFGPNASLHLAATYLERNLPEPYGSKVQTVLTEACCRNLSPARATLEANHERFEEWRRDLPFAELADGGTTLRLCYAAVYPTQEEVQRDSQVLSVKSFQSALGKVAQLVEEAPDLLSSRLDLDFAALSGDVRALQNEAPATLAQLAQLYLEIVPAAG
ncbi:MAG: hypothetical protein GY937_28155 [bacterium]|nr:hypothetical protein [bacterium]